MDKFATLWAIGPRNIADITLALFYIKAEEVKKRHAAIALPLMERLMSAWHGYSNQSKLRKQQRVKKMILIRAASALISVLTPAARKRLKNELTAD